MASKGPRSKLDHETRARRQKALEGPRGPRRPKAHWDHVLEEMVWLSKDFESERKWKLAQAKKVALRASKGMLDQATRGERKLKEEEQRLRKVALNISKDVKKFWIKIEKLVLYKHQMELDEKKKKALDKQLEFLLGQTERYSTMLAENLVDKPSQQYSAVGPKSPYEAGDDNAPVELNNDNDDDFDVQSDDDLEDDEHTIEEDEALITNEERQEELAALHNEIDLPIEELLKRYAVEKVGESSPENGQNGASSSVKTGHYRQNNRKDLSSASDVTNSSSIITGRRCDEDNGALSTSENPLMEIETAQTRNVSNVSGEQAKEPYDFSDGQHAKFNTEAKKHLLL